MALTPGEQALVARGNLVTSSFIPAESRARINAAIQSQQSSVPAVSDVDVKTWFEQNPQATDTQIAQAAKQFNVIPEQIARVTGVGLEEVNRRLQEATPFQDIATGGMLSSSSAPSASKQTTDYSGMIQKIYEDELGRSLGSVSEDQGALDYWTNQLTTGMLTPTTLRQAIESTPEGQAYDIQSVYSKTQQSPLDLMTSAQQTGSLSDLGSLFYNSRKSGVELPAEIIQSIGESRTTDPTTGYNYIVGGQAYAEGLEALDKAVQAGDQAKATEIQNALANENTFYDYYLQNIATNDNQAHSNLRNETLTGNIYGIGDPKGGLKGSLERGIVRLGDAIGDVVDNPFVQAAVTFAYPPAGAVLNAYATLDSGENLSPAQIAAALSGVNEMIPGGSGLGSQILSKLPEPVQDFVQSARDFANGVEGRAVAALKQAFPNVDTEKLAQYEDDIKQFLAGGEDVVRGVVGDENIEAISGSFAGIEDLIRGQFGTQQEQLDALAAALAADRTGGFVAQRGYQPGLPVDTQFDIDNGSLVLDILNQPSTRTA